MHTAAIQTESYQSEMIEQKGGLVKPYYLDNLNAQLNQMLTSF